MGHSLIWWFFIFSWLGVGVRYNTVKLAKEETQAKAQAYADLKTRIAQMETENERLDIRNASLLKGEPPWRLR